MQKLNEIIKSEAKNILIFLVLFFIFWKIIYYKESVFVILKLTLAHFYLFIMPGYLLMLYFYEKLNFVYRLILGICLGYAIQNFLVYYINILFDIKFQLFYKYTPIIIIVLSFVIIYFKFKK